MEALATAIWKPVKGYEGLYEVSNKGMVRSLNYRGTGRCEVLCQGGRGNSYRKVVLFKGSGKGLSKDVHRLVADAFLDNEEQLPEVNHKDEDKSNNASDNLEWCAIAYNRAYGSRGKKISKALSKPVEAFDSSGKVLHKFESLVAANQKGFSQAAISNVIAGRVPRHKELYWRFSDN